ncbi:hypothetical protein [Methanosarcina sp. KYL-1]|uniref:hypothetical protein n=1 Tax=Methanosarcina sp. KYL-1 TaxID=2602068 RepID=UPI0021006958|nr:hypothetical protein [Methanosarcina sp. KYL-1]
MKSWQFLVFAFVSVVPHLFYTAGADFAGMYTVYPCFPAGMGFLAFAQLYLIFSFFGWTSPFMYVSAVLFALLWTRILQWVESIDRFAVVIFYILVFFSVCWGILTKVMPPE